MSNVQVQANHLAPNRPEYRNKKFLCECGEWVGRQHMKRHKERKKHKLFLENPEEHKKLMDRLKKQKEDNPPHQCGCGIEVTNTKTAIRRHEEENQHHLSWDEVQKDTQ